MKHILFFLAALCFSLHLWAQDSLDKLASNFWAWRAQYQPFSLDDIPRIERLLRMKRSWAWK